MILTVSVTGKRESGRATDGARLYVGGRKEGTLRLGIEVAGLEDVLYPRGVLEIAARLLKRGDRMVGAQSRPHLGEDCEQRQVNEYRLARRSTESASSFMTIVELRRIESSAYRRCMIPGVPGVAPIRDT